MNAADAQAWAAVLTATWHDRPDAAADIILDPDSHHLRLLAVAAGLTCGLIRHLAQVTGQNGDDLVRVYATSLTTWEDSDDDNV